MNSGLSNKRRRRREPMVWNEAIEHATGSAFNWHCPFCGADLLETGYHRAHIDVVGNGIGLVPGNVVLSCPACNKGMHNTPARIWCMKRGIAFWPIQFTLEILCRVLYSNADIVGSSTIEKPKRSVTYTSDAKERALAYFEANPESVQLPVRELADVIGVGKSTIANAKREFSGR